MKKIIATLITFVLCTAMFAQNVTRITLFANSSSDVITCQAEQNLLINISKDGNIIDYGVEDYWNRLLKFMGRIEYYSANDDQAFRGKVRYIGPTQITYYASYDNDALKGKIKSIGSNVFDYYGAFEDEAVKGKIKLIGALQLSYFTSFDNESYKGRFKTIGSTSLAYYGSYDDKAIKGKIKALIT